MESQISPVKVWLMAIRTKTLIASLAPVLLGNILAIHTSSFSFLLFCLTLLFGLLVQIGTNFTNDYYDYLKGADTEKRIGPVRVMQARLLKKTTMLKAIFYTFFSTFILGIYLSTIGGIWIFILSLLAITLGFLYTVGPYSLSYLGLGDICVLIFFGPVATAGSYWLQTGSLPFFIFLAGLGPGLFSCAILTVNNLRDYREDLRANKKTLVVRFGPKFGQIEYVVCITCALCIPTILFYMNILNRIYFANIGIAFLSIFHIPKVFSKDPYVIQKALPLTAGNMLLYCSIFCASII